ncbi:MAG TPA: isoprenylcysteine carboxylmethyltransferase family protein [archaeon]|nr:isoprenylcysteine carboxylmethyltransferase family protein [archaeon]
MLIERYIQRLLKLAEKERSPAFKVLALAEGGLSFLVLIPWFLILTGSLAVQSIPFAWPRFVDRALGLAGLLVGLFWLVWAVWAQLTIGKGTPNLAAPPRRLIIKGPYRLCRNPLQLGVMLYYLGLGAWVADTRVGLFAFSMAFIFGSLYHRFVEEKELSARFGEEYEEYRKRTPFLLPRFW